MTTNNSGQICMNMTVVQDPVISLEISQTPDVDVNVSTSGGSADCTPTTAINVIQIEGGEVYTGPYSCTPQNYSQTFATSEKYMAADFLVHTVPTREESNDAGGVSLMIGV